MSYEPCIFSPESVADCSLTSFSDTSQLSLLSGSHTHAESYGSDLLKDGSQGCTCGKEMSDCLIHPSTPEKWIASMRDSLAKTLASLESRQAYLREPDQVFTEKYCVLLTSLDRDSYSWRTLQQSFLTDSEPFLETWPRWGMTQDGAAYAHPMSERRITETGGFCWPTPSATEHTGGGSAKSGIQALTNQRRPSGATMTFRLRDAVKVWPTPTTNDAKNSTLPESQRFQDGMAGALMRDGVQAGGQLNPNWVGWLMAFPIGWANSKATETRKYRSKRQQHGLYYTDKEQAA